MDVWRRFFFVLLNPHTFFLYLMSPSPSWMETKCIRYLYLATQETTIPNAKTLLPQNPNSGSNLNIDAQRSVLATWLYNNTYHSTKIGRRRSFFGHVTEQTRYHGHPCLQKFNARQPAANNIIERNGARSVGHSSCNNQGLGKYGRSTVM